MKEGLPQRSVRMDIQRFASSEAFFQTVPQRGVLAQKSSWKEERPLPSDLLSSAREVTWQEKLQKQLRQALLKHTKERPKDTDGLESFIEYFDDSYSKEGLPRDWYRLEEKIGFSMKTQMKLLENLDKDSLAVWMERTVKDIKGFSLEYLSDHLVYPCKYIPDPENPTRLVDPHYGNKDMVEITLDDERGGETKNALQEIKNFFTSPDTPNGSLAVMASPKGETGLYMDSGKPIVYEDSYFFIMEKMGDEVTNYTVKTDFSLFECRSALFALTGTMLSPTSTVEDYVREIATFKPGEKPTLRSVSDIVAALEKVRADYGSPFAFENVRWRSVYEDMQQGEKLYTFNENVQKMLSDFEKYCIEKIRSREELTKAVAATVLRISKYLLYDSKQEESQPVYNKPAIGVTDIFISSELQHYQPRAHRAVPVSFGTVLNTVADRPGCAGGGNTTVQGETVVSGDRTYVQSVVARRAAIIPTETSVSQAESKKSWNYEIGNCVIPEPFCGREKVLVGPCFICKDACQDKFDKGYIFKNGVWLKK